MVSPSYSARIWSLGCEPQLEPKQRHRGKAEFRVQGYRSDLDTGLLILSGLLGVVYLFTFKFGGLGLEGECLAIFKYRVAKSRASSLDRVVGSHLRHTV